MPLENEEVQNTNDGQDELNSDDSEPREPLVSKKLSASNTASIVSELEPAGGQNNKDSISEERNDAGRVATPDVDSNIQSTPLIDQYLQTNSTDSAAMNRNKIFLSAHLIPPVHVVPNATVSPEINQKSVGSDSNVPNSIAGMGKPKVIIPQHNLIPSTTSGSPNYFAKENVSLR